MQATNYDPDLMLDIPAELERLRRKWQQCGKLDHTEVARLRRLSDKLSAITECIRG